MAAGVARFVLRLFPCSARDKPSLQFDGVAVHWYDVRSQDFIAYITDWHDTFGRPIWVTEFACQVCSFYSLRTPISHDHDRISMAGRNVRRMKCTALWRPSQSSWTTHPGSGHTLPSVSQAHFSEDIFLLTSIRCHARHGGRQSC